MKEKEINTGNSCNKEDWSKLDANKTMLNHGDGLEVRSFASNLPEEMSLMEKAAKWSNERVKDFEELVKPLNEWLQKNYSPHHQIIISNDGAEIVCGVIGVPFKVLD